MQEEIKQVAEILGDSTAYAIAEYTKWYFMSAVWWFCTFFVLAATIAKANLVKFFGIDSYDAAGFKVTQYIIAALLLLIAASNVTNIFQPEAYAIHAVLRDALPH